MIVGDGAATVRDAAGGVIQVAGADPAYPARLGGLTDAPDPLWLRTTLRTDQLPTHVWTRPSVALVGSRGASGAGLELAQTLACGLSRNGVVVVSGLARGIDAAAHEGALLGGTPTVAVLACGLDRCYPAENGSLAEQIVTAGVLVSEWSAGTEALPWRFPRRNRIISGLADVVVLVEAQAHSGTGHTVRAALAQGREVMAVPRDPLLPGSVGPNRLLRDGAAPAAGVADILAVLERLPAQVGAAGESRGSADAGGPGPARPSARAESASEPPGAGVRGLLLTRLARGERLSTGEVLDAFPETGPGELLDALVTLEVEGRIGRDGRGRYGLLDG